MIFRKPEFIAQQQEQRGRLNFLCRGKAVQTRVNPDGRSTRVSIITEGMFLGISSQLLNGKFPFSFKAIEDCCAHALGKTRVTHDLSNWRGLQGWQDHGLS